LVSLVETIREYGIHSVAVPPLGCGYGGLDWSEVQPLIKRHLGELPNVHVELYAPDGAPAAEDMPNRTVNRGLTPGGAAVVGLVGKYKAALLDPFVRLIEIHKLMYFLEQAGEPLRLKFDKGAYGPYSQNLRHVLNRLEGHYLSGYGDGKDDPTKVVDLLPNAEEEAADFLAGRFDTEDRMARVATLIDGYEDPFGMELLGSVHWVMMHDEGAAKSVEKAAESVWAWNPRKAHLMKVEHIQRAWQRLKDQKWDTDVVGAI
jgi:O-acetyl-ADP-ribose deacetylase (regulator of RNase III)